MLGMGHSCECHFDKAYFTKDLLMYPVAINSCHDQAQPKLVQSLKELCLCNLCWEVTLLYLT